LSSDHERTMLRDAIRSLLQRHWPADKAKILAVRPADLTGIWRVLAEQGYAALGADPSSGGLQDILIVMEELGRAACPAPMLDTAIINLAFAHAGAQAHSFLTNLHSGEAYACVSFGAMDPDSAIGSVTVSSGRVSGKISFAEGAQSATHFVIFDPTGSRLIVAEANSDKVTLTPTRAMGADGLFSVEFSGAAAVSLPISGVCASDMLSISRLCYAARAWGAADRAFELAVAYVKDRKQFGQPVGRFQAVQHKLANNLIALMGVQLSVNNAASHYDRGIDHWRTFAAAAFAYSNMTLRQVSLETHHYFGAIGYAEDHEAPRHFKRVHLDIVRHGGGRQAREELAERHLGERSVELPQYDLGEAGNKFRREVREWLSKHWSPERRAAYEANDKSHRDHDEQFAREMGSTGWLGQRSSVDSKDHLTSC